MQIDSFCSSVSVSTVLNALLKKSKNKTLTCDLAVSSCFVMKSKIEREASSTPPEDKCANWNGPCQLISHVTLKMFAQSLLKMFYYNADESISVERNSFNC